ncbi:hypothetical protein TRVA0_009S01838 [Trichomonascus vanleenenianus]|uniref:DUF4396 domain-containing protein n=1 Tax=Trichomonascus vanleenenianus TaxID=2268995 RepID=UPI003ECB4FEA
MNKLIFRQSSIFRYSRAVRSTPQVLSIGTRIGPAQPFSSLQENFAKVQSQCPKSTPNAVPSVLDSRFWTLRSAWKRASVNTLRCLAGCTLGDFSAMWLLQTFSPDLGTGTIMAISMAAGIATSITLETVLLHRGKDQLSWPMAVKTAAGMSLVSMLTMEAMENLVDYHLTGGVVTLDDPAFWVAAVLSMGAGYLAPLPYNYLRLRKYGKACH